MSDNDVRALASRVATIALSSNGETRSEDQLIAALRTLFHRETWPIETYEQAKLLGTDKETLEDLVTRNPSAGRLFLAVNGNMVVPPLDGPKLSSEMKYSYSIWFSSKMHRLNKGERKRWKKTKKTLSNFLKRKSSSLSSSCYSPSNLKCSSRKEEKDYAKAERKMEKRRKDEKRKAKKEEKRARKHHKKREREHGDAGSDIETQAGNHHGDAATSINTNMSGCNDNLDASTDTMGVISNSDDDI